MLDEPHLLAENPWVTRRPISVAEYHRMGETGILTRDDRVELIEGQLIAMAPIGSYHHGTVNKLNYALMHAVGDQAVVSVQGPVRLDEFNEPEPDFALLRPMADFYQARHPGPDDVLLLIEVADTSLAYDRRVKRALYARHGISELWIVDLAAGQLEVCRQPAATGYAACQLIVRDGSVEPALLPGVHIPLAGLFG